MSDAATLDRSAPAPVVRQAGLRDTGTSVNLNGWHTASAVTYADVNRAIAAQETSPGSFSVAASDGSASATGQSRVAAACTPASGSSASIGASEPRQIGVRAVASDPRA